MGSPCYFRREQQLTCVRLPRAKEASVYGGPEEYGHSCDRAELRSLGRNPAGLIDPVAIAAVDCTAGGNLMKLQPVLLSPDMIRARKWGEFRATQTAADRGAP
jgi:hypothetical protein